MRRTNAPSSSACSAKASSPRRRSPSPEASATAEAASAPRQASRAVVRSTGLAGVRVAEPPCTPPTPAAGPAAEAVARRGVRIGREGHGPSAENTGHRSPPGCRPGHEGGALPLFHPGPTLDGLGHETAPQTRSITRPDRTRAARSFSSAGTSPTHASVLVAEGPIFESAAAAAAALRATLPGVRKPLFCSDHRGRGHGQPAAASHSRHGKSQTTVLLIGFQNDYFAADGILHQVLESSSRRPTS